MAKKPRILLPAGIAVWPKLDVPDHYQPVDKKGRPNGEPKIRYLTDVSYDDKTLEKVRAQILKITQENYADELEDGEQPKLTCFRKSKKTEEVTLQATSGAKFKPPVFDAKNQRVPDDVVIGGGSKIRLDVTVNYYSGFGGGVNLYINAVQLLELKESSFGKSNFDEADGYTYGDGASDSNDSDEADAADGDEPYAF